MNKFEKSIKEQLIAYSDMIEVAEEHKNKTVANAYRAELRGYLKGLETCLNKNYVSTFVGYVKARY